MVHASCMAVVRLNRPDLYPPSTRVTVHPPAGRTERGRPFYPAIAEGTVDNAGWLVVDDDAITRLMPYVAFAEINGEPRQASLRATPA